MHRRLRRRRDDDEPDAASGEVIVEPGERLPRIGLGRLRPLVRRVDTTRELRRLEERPAGHVFDVRPVEQPPAAPRVGAFVAGAEPPGHYYLRVRAQGAPDPGSIFQAALESVQPRQDNAIGRDDSSPQGIARPGRRRRGRCLERSTGRPLGQRNNRNRPQERGQQHFDRDRRNGGVAHFAAGDLLAAVRVAHHQKMK
jgi:hypothetical protein